MGLLGAYQCILLNALGKSIRLEYGNTIVYNPLALLQSAKEIKEGSRYVLSRSVDSHHTGSLVCRKMISQTSSFLPFERPFCP